jgi:hypothetical protein
VQHRLWKILGSRRAVLIAANLIGGAAVLTWCLQVSWVDRIQNTKPRAPAALPIPRPTSRTQPALDRVQSHALFHASRTFYVPPAVPATPVDLKPPAPAFRVVSVLMSGNRPPLALLTDGQSKGILKVRQGDVVAGWTVESVASKRVVLVYQNEHIELGPRLSTDAQGHQSTLSTRSNVTSMAGGVRVLGKSSAATSEPTAAVGSRPTIAPRLLDPPRRP